jgi:hypothetical protein
LLEETPGPDPEKLAVCYREWLRRGYNPSAWTWVMWYRDGIPGPKKRVVVTPNGNDPLEEYLHGAEQAGGV